MGLTVCPRSDTYLHRSTWDNIKASKKMSGLASFDGHNYQQICVYLAVPGAY